MSADRPLKFTEESSRENFVIKNPSQDLLYFAISRLPLKPVFSEVTLSAARLEGAMITGEYLEACQAKEVAPLTTLRLAYDKDAGVFNPSIGVARIRMSDYREEKIARGRQTAALLYTASFSDVEITTGKEGFADLQSLVHPSLRSAGYDVNRAFLKVTGDADYDVHIEGDTSVLLGPNTIRVQWGSSTSHNEREKLEGWFDGLLKDHQPFGSPSSG